MEKGASDGPLFGWDQWMTKMLSLPSGLRQGRSFLKGRCGKLVELWGGRGGMDIQKRGRYVE